MNNRLTGVRSSRCPAAGTEGYQTQQQRQGRRPGPFRSSLATTGPPGVVTFGYARIDRRQTLAVDADVARRTRRVARAARRTVRVVTRADVRRAGGSALSGDRGKDTLPFASNCVADVAGPRAGRIAAHPVDAVAGDALVGRATGDAQDLLRNAGRAVAVLACGALSVEGTAGGACGRGSGAEIRSACGAAGRARGRVGASAQSAAQVAGITGAGTRAVASHPVDAVALDALAGRAAGDAQDLLRNAGRAVAVLACGALSVEGAAGRASRRGAGAEVRRTGRTSR